MPPRAARVVLVGGLAGCSDLEGAQLVRGRTLQLRSCSPWQLLDSPAKESFRGKKKKKELTAKEGIV